MRLSLVALSHDRNISDVLAGMRPLASIKLLPGFMLDDRLRAVEPYDRPGCSLVGGSEKRGFRNGGWATR
ncbi:MAG: hypothetical protein AW10_00476 [Candidatus Accumulibacter appositus]|uniref:Uncharacterized protein n=1 Tax=Candidatus Accumulibacter appositus TaxID=1454003 RepID=A0A011NHW7_9PROT|nr:MAG: hypothetical protein AW10_00476 [Candidatus Accumulibacter appositus]